MPRQKLVEPQPLPYLQSQIAVAESSRTFHPDLLHQHPCDVRIIGRFYFRGKQLQLGALAVLVEHLHGLLPTRVSRTVQFPEITKRALPRTIDGTHRLDQRPIAVLLAVFYSLMLAEKHSVAIMSAENQRCKRLGLHYNVIFIASGDNQSLRRRNQN